MVYRSEAVGARRRDIERRGRDRAGGNEQLRVAGDFG